MTAEDHDKILLDTNVVIYLTGSTTWKADYLPLVRGKRLHISFMTLAELLEHCYQKSLGEEKIRLLAQTLKQEHTVLPYNENVCYRFGWIRHLRRKRPISVLDALIAATALSYELPLVTHNVRDFEGIEGLNVITKYRRTI
jgi:predicted nucleic acid-binding protein